MSSHEAQARPELPNLVQHTNVQANARTERWHAQKGCLFSSRNSILSMAASSWEAGMIRARRFGPTCAGTFERRTGNKHRRAPSSAADKMHRMQILLMRCGVQSSASFLIRCSMGPYSVGNTSEGSPMAARFFCAVPGGRGSQQCCKGGV